MTGDLVNKKAFSIQQSANAYPEPEDQDRQKGKNPRASA
jgi:hypothetical protein